MARRRHAQEEHDNHERWLVSYADFITLLFAFFVVMYALSSVNEGKYRILSNSMVSAFRNVRSTASGRPDGHADAVSGPVATPSLASKSRRRRQAEGAREDAQRGQGDP
jgi:chemotaxis protein MotB